MAKKPSSELDGLFQDSLNMILNISEGLHDPPGVRNSIGQDAMLSLLTLTDAANRSSSSGPSSNLPPSDTQGTEVHISFPDCRSSWYRLSASDPRYHLTQVAQNPLPEGLKPTVVGHHYNTRSKKKSKPPYLAGFLAGVQPLPLNVAATTRYCCC